MNSKIKNLTLGAIPFFVLFLAWWCVYYFSIFPRWITPSPFKTAETFFGLISDGTLISLAWMSLQNALLGFAIASVAAIVLGVLIGVYPTARKIFFPFFSAVYVVPSLAWLPLIVLIFGFTGMAIICVIFLSSFKKIVYSVVSGVRNVNGNWILAGKNLGLDKIEIINKIILPAAFPQIITGIRMGFGNAWRSLIGAEMLVAGAAGLGKFIWMAQWFFDFSKVLSGIAVIALVGMLVEHFVFKPLEDSVLVRWGFVREDS